MNEQYLEHHGVKGQKWGVRRYQNKDGSLTKAGRDRTTQKFDKVANSKIRSAYHTARAKNTLKMNILQANSIATQSKALADKRDKQYRKAMSKFADDKTVKRYGNNEKRFNRDVQKAINLGIERDMLRQNYKDMRAFVKEANIKLSDINSGKLKAGRDFITETVQTAPGKYDVRILGRNNKSK